MRWLSVLLPPLLVATAIPLVLNRAPLPATATQPSTLTATPTPPPTLTSLSTLAPSPTPESTPAPSPTPTRVPAYEGEKIGVGMSYAIPEEDWRLLGRPLLYAWSARADYGQQYGMYFTPMLAKCNEESLRQAVDWPRQGDYMLVFNEPDDVDNGSGCGDVRVAARYVHRLHVARPDLRLIVGGIVGGWSWLREFGKSYRNMYGHYPEVAGIHVHVYPRALNTWQAYSQAAKIRIGSWRAFQEAVPWARGELWITELGVLDDVPLRLVNAYMRDILVWAAAQDFVSRVYWFAYEGRPGVPNVWWPQTMLVWDGERTPLWWTMQDCVDGECLGVSR